jgi:integrase
MSDSKPRYFVEKPQKGGSVLYYWQPSKSLASAGYKTAPLSRNRAEAIKQAEELNQRVDRWRGGLPVLAQNRHGTLPWLIEQYKNSPQYMKLRDATKNSQRSRVNRILKWSAEKGDPPMRTIRRADAIALWKQIYEVEGHPGYAEQIVTVCSKLWNFALKELEDHDIVDRNPFSALRLPKQNPRDEIWMPEQTAAVIEAASTLPRIGHDHRVHGYGFPSMVLAIKIGRYTALRKGDVLDLRVSQYDGEYITCTPSKTRDKTGVTVHIPVHPDLKVALDDHLFGTSYDGKVVSFRPSPDRRILINETTGRPWGKANFASTFRKICDRAGIPQNMQYRDLRRTAATALAEAGCSLHKIAAIGGWSIQSVAQMMAVYARANRIMADNAMAKLLAYRKQSDG